MSKCIFDVHAHLLNMVSSSSLSPSSIIIVYVTKCFLKKYYKIMYVQICVCTILRIFFKKINFETNLTLEIFLTSILIILILIFHILDFDFEYFQLHYLLYCTVLHHRLAIWMTYDHLFVFHDSRYSVQG